MRRLAALVALAGAGVLGLGSAFVLARPEKAPPGEGKIAICHAPPGQEGQKFDYITPDASGDLNGHANHPDDIIPAIGTNPARNLITIYPSGWSGADILANNCDIPAAMTGSTETVTTTVTERVPVTVTAAGTTVTLPGTTTTKEITVTVSVPSETVSAPGTTTVVTVPSNVTTTVTLPTATVTLPAVTETIAGETIERPPSTVTLPGTTATVTGGATTTVVTVTGPNKAVRDGVLAAKHARVTLTTPSRVVTVRGRVVRVLGTGKLAGKKFIVVIVHASGCPAGTAPYNGKCSPIAYGKG